MDLSRVAATFFIILTMQMLTFILKKSETLRVDFHSVRVNKELRVDLKVIFTFETSFWPINMTKLVYCL